jgi:hypothetical protein
VIPPIYPLPRFAVIGRPAEICGVNVGGQAFLEPMHLVGADKVHFASEGGLVARAAQVVGVGWDIGREFGGVVVDAGAVGELARHKAGAGGGAERAGGVGVGEADGFLGKFAQVWDVEKVGGAIWEQGSGQLIDHQDQDVGFGHFSLRYAKRQSLAGDVWSVPNATFCGGYSGAFGEDICEQMKLTG